MPLTTCDLYRGGNASSARMDNVRDSDAVKYVNHADGDKVWVRGRQKGISTFDNCKGTSKWWKLNQGYVYSANLRVINDHGDHYSWQPNMDMRLADFVALLQAVNPNFNRYN